MRTINEDECNAKVRPIWTAQGKLLYVGELVDTPRLGRSAPSKASQLRVSRTKYIPEVNCPESTSSFPHLLTFLVTEAHRAGGYV